MNKTRKIFAITGVLVLFLLYASTLYFAIFDASEGMIYFQASVLGTIFFPIVLYAMKIYHNLGKNRVKDNEKSES